MTEQLEKSIVRVFLIMLILCLIVAVVARILGWGKNDPLVPVTGTCFWEKWTEDEESLGEIRAAKEVKVSEKYEAGQKSFDEHKKDKEVRRSFAMSTPHL